MKECKAQQEIGQDEYDSAMTEVHQDFQECMEEIGVCYQMIIKTLGEKCPHDVAEQICAIAVELLNNDVQTRSGQLMIIEGVSLFADFSENLTAELAYELMQHGFHQIIGYLQVDHGCIDLIRNTFYTFYEYLKKTNDRQIANDATLLQLAMQMLNTFKEDGSEEALGAYDNVCSYMSIAGKIVGQTSEYWGPLLGYVQAMESDNIEITHMCQFYIDELSNNNPEIVKV